MGMKEAYQKKLQAQLDEWNAEIEQLKAKADKAEAESQLEYYKKIEELRTTPGIRSATPCVLQKNALNKHITLNKEQTGPSSTEGGPV
jgi:hypothetical protein